MVLNNLKIRKEVEESERLDVGADFIEYDDDASAAAAAPASKSPQEAPKEEKKVDTPQLLPQPLHNLNKLRRPQKQLLLALLLRALWLCLLEIEIKELNQ